MIGTVSDGDIPDGRCWLRLIWRLSVTILLERKAETYTKPVTAKVGTSRGTLLELMRQYVLHEIPLLKIPRNAVR